MAITIRNATSGDTDTLAAFNTALALETEGKILEIETARLGVGAVLDDPAKGAFYIAEFDGRTAGSLLITPEWSDWENSYFWWIQSVYVLPEFRRHGIYKALYRHIEDLARSSGRVRGLKLYVEKNNHAAKAVYEKLGMTRAAHEIYETREPFVRNRLKND
ncbi:MAG: GNAT family N-acetyltransferase [bacterium]